MIIIWVGVFLDADSESPPITYRVECFLGELWAIKLFWSRDRLVQHELDCLGLRLGLWLGLWLGLGFM